MFKVDGFLFLPSNYSVVSVNLGLHYIRAYFRALIVVEVRLKEVKRFLYFFWKLFVHPELSITSKSALTHSGESKIKH